MIKILAVLVASFLSVALVAFGWMPCPACCGIVTGCCPSLGVPTTLYATFVRTAGTCTVFDLGTVTLTYVPAAQSWQNNSVACRGMFFRCNFLGFWEFQVSAPDFTTCASLPCNVYSSTAYSWFENPPTCPSPFTKTGSFTADFHWADGDPTHNCCGAGFGVHDFSTYQVTITE